MGDVTDARQTLVEQDVPGLEKQEGKWYDGCKKLDPKSFWSGLNREMGGRPNIDKDSHRQSAVQRHDPKVASAIRIRRQTYRNRHSQLVACGRALYVIRQSAGKHIANKSCSTKWKSIYRMLGDGDKRKAALSGSEDDILHSPPPAHVLPFSRLLPCSVSVSSPFRLWLPRCGPRSLTRPCSRSSPGS